MVTCVCVASNEAGRSIWLLRWLVAGSFAQAKAPGQKKKSHITSQFIG